ncbi:phage tail sheath subtilisin-like domain-containing protein [Clostridium saccharobutylicum]|nr:phage tail sheath subtilisin-like domain-containing protein [Clostridium saccharobutylicum]AQR91251.1 phage tail sheath protein [Clostridium saccharobutylicum]AQS01155.1 phage tail sheath protein [Clostridium saccharobutylicum]AQS10568.1 phage tail sheath protein [Clostridium saccharobutylicum]AQS15138.1 phage tail sheath protein [Clostridium saccharobutylicum]MBA8983323.1 hypothetical protein [Clostridium saccharobutylicum]
MPEVIISFTEKASTAKARSARGVACIVLKDATVSGIYKYKRYKNVTQSYSDDNKAIIKDCFDLGVNTLVVCAIATAGTTSDALTSLAKVSINYLAFGYDVTADEEAIKTFIENRRENNMKLSVVTANFAADYEGVINFTAEEIKVNGIAMTTQRFTIRVAVILAGIPQTQSATYYVLSDVTGVKDKVDENTCVDNGELFITFDGEKYKLSRGVNSLKTITLGKKECMKKIKITEGMDLVSGDIYTTFRDNYTGKVINDYADKMLFVAEANEYLRNLGKEGVLNKDADNYVELDVEATRDYLESELKVDTTDMEDEEVLKQDTGAKLFLTGQITLQDTMEDLELSMFF